MGLEERARRILDDPAHADPDEVLGVLSGIVPLLQSPLTRKYLEGKMAAASAAPDPERPALCRALLPYLEWYLQDP